MNDASKLAIDESIRILEMSEGTKEDDKIFGTIIRAKCAVIGHVVNAQLRVAEESFRQHRFDRLPELLKLIAEEEQRLPLMKIVAQSF